MSLSYNHHYYYNKYTPLITSLNMKTRLPGGGRQHAATTAMITARMPATLAGVHCFGPRVCFPRLSLQGNNTAHIVGHVYMHIYIYVYVYKYICITVCMYIVQCLVVECMYVNKYMYIYICVSSTIGSPKR